MKKSISLLLALVTLLSLTACGKKNTSGTQASANGESSAQTSTKTEGKKSQKVEPIEDYLVTVELTPENFWDYFGMEVMHKLDDWGDIEEYGESFHMYSKAYDNGLIIYTAGDYRNQLGDAQYEWKYGDRENYSTERLSDDFYEQYGTCGCHSRFYLGEDWIDDGLGEKTCENGNVHPIENLELGRVKGTVTFVKAEYIDHVESDVEEERTGYGYKILRTSIYLKNGDILIRRGREGFMY